MVWNDAERHELAVGGIRCRRLDRRPERIRVLNDVISGHHEQDRFRVLLGCQERRQCDRWRRVAALGLEYDLRGRIDLA